MSGDPRGYTWGRVAARPPVVADAWRVGERRAGEGARGLKTTSLTAVAVATNATKARRSAVSIGRSPAATTAACGTDFDGARNVAPGWALCGRRRRRVLISLLC